MKPKYCQDCNNDPNNIGPTLEEKSSILGWLTFGWLSKLFKTGYKRALEMSDLNFLRSIDHTEVKY